MANHYTRVVSISSEWNLRNNWKSLHQPLISNFQIIVAGTASIIAFWRTAAVRTSQIEGEGERRVQLFSFLKDTFRWTCQCSDLLYNRHVDCNALLIPFVPCTYDYPKPTNHHTDQIHNRQLLYRLHQSCSVSFVPIDKHCWCKCQTGKTRRFHSSDHQPEVLKCIPLYLWGSNWLAGSCYRPNTNVR